MPNYNAEVRLCAIKHTLKFSTIYLPASLKNFRLKLLDSGSYQQASINSNKFEFEKILIKQSYLILVWLHHLTRFSNSNLGNNTSIVANKESNSNLKQGVKISSEKIPMFFVYPSRNYKFTIIKSPMAHKTFSQEQFICRTYRLSISFNSYKGYDNNVFSLELNKSLYLTHYLLKNLPYISTNMFFLQRYSLGFSFLESNFFLFKF